MKWSTWRKIATVLMGITLLIGGSNLKEIHKEEFLAPYSPLGVIPSTGKPVMEKLYLDLSYPFPSRFWFLPGTEQTDTNGNKVHTGFHEMTGSEIQILETGDYYIAQLPLPTDPQIRNVMAWERHSLKEISLKELLTKNGDSFNRYYILKNLGVGGMGTVDLAWDAQQKTYVAIKRLHAKASGNREILKRFHREAEIMSSMDHPNVVKIIEKGEFPFDYYVMEFLEGRSLKEIIKQGPLSIAQSVETLLQAAGGLNYVHHMEKDGEPLGIVHRDIKPDNLFVSATGRVLILDFGISHVSNMTQLTQTGNIMGTPHYMSPEQVEPHHFNNEIDNRTDIYALGVLLYASLTGESPFKAKSLTKLLEIKMVDAAHEEFLFEGCLKDKINGSDEKAAALEKIILKAAAFYPEDRYQDVSEMIAELNQLKKDFPELEITSFGLDEHHRLSTKTVNKQLESTIIHPRQKEIPLSGKKEVSVKAKKESTGESTVDFDFHQQLDETVLEMPQAYLDYKATEAYLETAL